MKLGLIYPHQLFEHHPVIEEADSARIVHEGLILGGDAEWPLTPHAKKLTMHLAAMLAYAEQWEVEQISSISEVEWASVDELIVCRLFDDVLERRLRAQCDLNGVTFTELETPGFVTPREWGEAFFASKKKPFMKTFYEAQRKRMGIMVDENGQPEGGRWSFDDENRKKFPVKKQPPAEPVYQHTEEEKKYIRISEETIKQGKQGKFEYFGEPSGLRYPITHAGARVWLEQFLLERYAEFGTYEDALTSRSVFLYHSALTPMLNKGLLDPREVVDRAVEVGRELGVEINNIEGFVRQVIGWREFMSLMYLKHGRFLRTQNFWGFSESMPKSIYGFKTGIPPVDDVLEKVRDEAYAHHIERLMVMGNFFMLLRIKPHDVFQWFSEFFIDAYDWVMVPNVYGMSQFSDGGLMVTKPYISGSNYIRKMSDYKAGDWCEVWDALFWSFIDDHREFFAKQYRMKMMLSHLNKMGSEKLAKHHEVALAYREKLQQGGFLGDEFSLV